MERFPLGLPDGKVSFPFLCVKSSIWIATLLWVLCGISCKERLSSPPEEVPEVAVRGGSPVTDGSVELVARIWNGRRFSLTCAGTNEPVVVKTFATDGRRTRPRDCYQVGVDFEGRSGKDRLVKVFNVAAWFSGDEIETVLAGFSDFEVLSIKPSTLGEWKLVARKDPRFLVRGFPKGGAFDDTPVTVEDRPSVGVAHDNQRTRNTREDSEAVRVVP